MQERLVNNAQTTLAGVINDTQTTIVVTNASQFPDSGQFRILVEQELMLVTEVADTTWVVQRGVEGTSARTHAGSVSVMAVLTKGAIEAYMPPWPSEDGAYQLVVTDGVPAWVGSSFS